MVNEVVFIIQFHKIKIKLSLHFRFNKKTGKRKINFFFNFQFAIFFNDGFIALFMNAVGVFNFLIVGF